MAAGTDLEQGKPDLRGGWSDKAVLRHRPKIVVDSEAENNASCSARARKLIEEGRLQGLTITATVQGHRIIAPGQPTDGQLWKPGQRIHVYSEPHNLDGVYFLMGRKFTCSRMDGTRTVLTLKEDGVWLAGAHAHKKNGKGKSAAPLQIIAA